MSTLSTYHDGKNDPQADACGESPTRNESEDARPDFENAEHDDVDDDDVDDDDVGDDNVEHDDVDDDDNRLDLYMMPDHVKWQG